MATRSNTKTIIIASAFVIVAFIIYMIVNKTTSGGRSDEQVEVTCGNKKVFRYKYPSEAFPMFARDYNNEVSFTTNVLQRVSDSLGSQQIGVDAKNKVKELQEKLNQDNITFSTGLRSYFMNVNADPCNDTMRQKLLAFTEEMTRRMFELRTTTAEVTTITEKGTGSDTAVTENKYVLVKDSAVIKKSINKLSELLQKNTKFNRMATVVPAATRMQQPRRETNPN